MVPPARIPEMELVVEMRPFSAIISGANALVTRHGPKALTIIVSSNSSYGASITDPCALPAMVILSSEIARISRYWDRYARWAASQYYLARHRINCPIRWFDIL